MKKTLNIFPFIGFIFTVILGTLLHFAFDLSDGNTLVGAFTPVNESVWEHLKLLLYPVLIYSGIEYLLVGKSIANYISGRIYSLIVGMICIVSLFYTYTGISGVNYPVADISIFIISAAIVFISSTIFNKHKSFLATQGADIVSIIIITAVIILFIYFTFNPPMSELFRDPISGDFGILSGNLFV